MDPIRNDWSAAETFQLMTSPLQTLFDRAKQIHKLYAAKDIQKCVLLSIKTGGCPENCAYCSQSSHYETPIDAQPLMQISDVICAANQAQEDGAKRFCMGAAWRQVPEDDRFEKLLKMIRAVASTGMEVCCTLGMAKQWQLEKMREAGLTAYNHNLDTSRDYYSKIITTRTYGDRIETLNAVRRAQVQICSGGILGMGESMWDRAAMLAELACFVPHPESVPINLLVPIEGTPLQNAQPVPFEEFLRAVATARILMPRSRVRLSAGRNQLTQKQQLACFEMGANSIFIGEKLLTAPNVTPAEDAQLYQKMGKTNGVLYQN